MAAPVAAEDVPNVVAAPTATRSATTTPKPPRHSGKGRRVVYSVTHQRVWLVGGAGRVKHTYLVSGRLSQPSPGHYRVYSKSRWTSSTVSAETMQYMVRFTHGERTGTPIGFHSIPRDYSGHPAQSVDDLGKPLSTGASASGCATRPSSGTSPRSARASSSSRGNARHSRCDRGIHRRVNTLAFGVTRVPKD